MVPQWILLWYDSLLWMYKKRIFTTFRKKFGDLLWNISLSLTYVTLSHPSNPWWRHQMEIFSALLAFCVGNSPVTGEFPAQRPVTRSLDVFFDLGLYQQLSKRWRRRWFETPWRSLYRHCNASFSLQLGEYSYPRGKRILKFWSMYFKWRCTLAI